MSDRKKVVYAAWFSEDGGKRWGTRFWRRENGEEVEVTVIFGVGEEVSDARYGWSDRVCLGPVVEYVRSGRVGSEKERYL